MLIKRYQRKTFFQIEDEYHLINKGVTEMTTASNAKTEEIHFIGDKNAQNQLAGYAPSTTVTAVAYTGDAFNDYIMDLGRSLDIGEKSHSKICTVDTWTDPTGSKCVATEVGVVIVMDNPGSGAPGNLGVTCTLNFETDPVVGTFNLETNTFTADGAEPSGI